MYKSSTVVVLAAVISLAAFSVYAEGTDGMQKDMGQKTATEVHQGRGIVNKMDLDAGKVNINHEAIKSLKWPKMTMDFNVQDISALARIKPGMKVDFELAKFGNGYRITRIEQAKE